MIGNAINSDLIFVQCIFGSMLDSLYGFNSCIIGSVLIAGPTYDEVC